MSEDMRSRPDPLFENGTAQKHFSSRCGIPTFFLLEMMLSDRKAKREIRHLEQELPRWHGLVEKVTGVNPVEFDSQTLAVLRGRMVRYLMRSKEVISVDIFVFCSCFIL